MDDPPLHTLCQTCHLLPPLYTCPRCSLRSCSLTCVQTHKRRADCSGLRDPTVYKPMRDLATPAGIDHDFNFLSKIERGVERSDKVAVEGGLVGSGDVRGGPGFGREERRGGGRGGRGGGGGGGRGGYGGEGGEAERKVGREISQKGVRWERLPMGMGRRKANGTSWSKKRGCLVWQVEWVAPADASSTSNTSTVPTATTPTVPGMLGPLSKILATTPLDEAYTAFLEETRRAALTPEEKAGEKKRRATSPSASPGVEAAPRAEAGTGTDEASTVEGEVQADITTADAGVESQNPTPAPAPTQPQTQPQSPYTFYLHRPLTLSSGPTVLIPLRSDEGLDTQLGGRVILEFPRVYVFPAGASLPGCFEIEGGNGVEDREGEEGGEEEEGEEVVVSDTSSSGSSSEDEESEEEESGSEGEDEESGDGGEGFGPEVGEGAGSGEAVVGEGVVGEDGIESS
ncbi:hypothetical protein VE01_03704 [Pseudogymnoascus verrucosus]|uniref:HIT-type domain-containing protein n=1 Tax=Pseudogymnoascus verrucosus TaxID=342668 RepID=A0A1B8GQH3_9PEZI|nr:uncharacterized protein VE01_03704 [Pseudogymnoascus verrucosus]OBT98086.1 hypothetical protein VE01_03704 [Pseudogymnoascus verrucosus]